MVKGFHLQTTPLNNVFWSTQSSLWRKLGLVLIGVCLLGLSSQASIPLHPVPLTFQSATVLLIGMAYGPRLGASVIMAYWLAGILGVPVFADLNAGFPVFLEPDGGYLLGFLPGVVVAGYLTQYGWSKHVASGFAAAFIGAIALFACGVLGLRFFMDWHNAWLVGVKPFIFTEILKLVMVAWMAKRCWQA